MIAAWGSSMFLILLAVVFGWADIIISLTSFLDPGAARVTGPSGSAVGVRVWSSVWQFCVLSAIRLVSGIKRHCKTTVLHVGGNRWASSLLFNQLSGHFSYCLRFHSDPLNLS